jgi:hypothetical protein
MYLLYLRDKNALSPFLGLVPRRIRAEVLGADTVGTRVSPVAAHLKMF